MAETKSYPRNTIEHPAKNRGDLTFDPKVDVVNYARQYAKEKPDVAALWCLGIGFILGWKLKPW